MTDKSGDVYLFSTEGEKEGQLLLGKIKTLVRCSTSRMLKWFQLFNKNKGKGIGCILFQRSHFYPKW